jgi:outer membrane assembly lipoprotein YfiO
MDTILELLLDASIRAILIAAAVGGILRALRVKSPGAAHKAWTGVLLIMLLLPALSFWAPRLPIPILPSVSIHREIQDHSPALSDSFSRGKIAEGRSAGLKASGASGPATPDLMKKKPDAGPTMFQAILAVYFTGFCYFALRLLTGMRLSHRLGRNAQRDARGFYYSGCTVPLTMGLFRTRILLPEDAKRWDPQKLEAVLDHESEHVRRHDSLVAWLALLNRCIFWFHPVAWWLRGKLTALAEEACDEKVLARGHDSGAYAGYLLEFARSVREKKTLVPLGVAPFHGSRLTHRIRRIVTPVRTPPVSRGRLVAVAALCVLAALVPAVVEPARVHTTPVRPNEPYGAVPSDAAAVPSRQSSTDSSNSRDENLYETGLKLLETHQYKEARQVFENLMEAFPESGFAAPSLLAIADSFYNEGGAKNLDEALYNYYRYLILFPVGPKADEIELKTIALNAKRISGTAQYYAGTRISYDFILGIYSDRKSDSYKHFMERDGVNAYDPFTAEEIINRFLKKYPDSDLVPTAKQALLDVRENLAYGYFIVAGSEYDRGDYVRSLSHLKTIIDRYPAFSRIDEVRQLYESLSHAGR